MPPPVVNKKRSPTKPEKARKTTLEKELIRRSKSSKAKPTVPAPTPKSVTPANAKTNVMKVREALEAIATANGKFGSCKNALGEKAWKDGRANLKSVAAYLETYLEECGDLVK